MVAAVRGRPKFSYRATQTHQDSALLELGVDVFESSPKAPAVGSKEFLSGGLELIPEFLASWDAERALALSPLHLSEPVVSIRDREEFLVGAHMLGLLGPGKTLKPQQLLVADCLARYDPYFALLMPRRSTKTTNLFAVALGRCASRPDYLVAYSQMTTGIKARDRFRKDIVAPLERTFKHIPEDERPFKINRTGGAERVEFDNGSVFQVFPPDGASFRGEAFDLIILDEAGEATPDAGEDVLAGALATFDTRQDAQLIVAGTAADYRKGNLLWDYLEDGRLGRDRVGILEYAAPDSTTEDELNDRDRVIELVLLSHPGVGNLTTLETVMERYSKQPRHRFAAEYLSIFGLGSAAGGIFDLDRWRDGAVDGLPEVPARFTLAMSVHPDQTTGSLVAVWRDDERKVHVLLLEHYLKLDKFHHAARDVAVKHKTPIVHDTNGPVTEIVLKLQHPPRDREGKPKPKPQLKPQTFPHAKTAAALIVKEVATGNVVHYTHETQAPLDEAVRVAVKRPLGPNAWALGRAKGREEDDITAIEAAGLALRVYDSTPQSTRRRTVVRT